MWKFLKWHLKWNGKRILVIEYGVYNNQLYTFGLQFSYSFEIK